MPYVENEYRVEKQTSNRESRHQYEYKSWALSFLPPYLDLPFFFPLLSADMFRFLL